MLPSLSEVDEALGHLAKVPKEQRGAAWHAFADAVLTERDFVKLLDAAPEAVTRETRVMLRAEERSNDALTG